MTVVGTAFLAPRLLGPVTATPDLSHAGHQPLNGDTQRYLFSHVAGIVTQGGRYGTGDSLEGHRSRQEIHCHRIAGGNSTFQFRLSDERYDLRYSITS